MQGFKGVMKRPKFYEYFDRRMALEPSAHMCSHATCGEPATHIGGYYLVGPRRVRVWYCLEHLVGSPITLLPTPAEYLYAEQEEVKFHAEQEKRYYRFVDGEFSESIKTLAPSGHGEPIPFDRVKSWRWGS